MIKAIKIESDGTYKGYFYCGQKHGSGTTRHANGDISEGSWKNDKRHGFGILTVNDYTIHVGWKDDLMDGESTTIHKDGTGHQSYWIKGVMQ